MTAASVSGRDADLDAVRLLLSRLGVSPEELLQSPMVRPVVPTFREYLPVVRAAVGVGTLRAYSSYWNRIEEQWGERRMDDVKASDISSLVEFVKANRIVRRNARSGCGTGRT
ncbi:hypothetical protein AB0K00_33175 [Dactylosporangium sp. NPDC049525]|uniref:hypothetical protein n=1 Tax=Dactylosporangium sp. NPDC049525 TaxID=3154730 RepID=UPI00342B7C70